MSPLLGLPRFWPYLALLSSWRPRQWGWGVEFLEQGQPWVSLGWVGWFLSLKLFFLKVNIQA